MGMMDKLKSNSIIAQRKIKEEKTIYVVMSQDPWGKTWGVPLRAFSNKNDADEYLRHETYAWSYITTVELN